MRITLEEAKRLVGWADEDDMVWHVKEFPLGWYFWVESRRFMETGALEDVTFGSMDYFVIAATGEVISARSGVSSLDAEADILQMADRNLTLDQSHFDAYVETRLREDPRFLTKEELIKVLQIDDQPKGNTGGG